MTEITHNNLFHAQRLLYEWLCLSGKRSYEAIRKNCLYLDEAYSLGYGSSSVWRLFNPLVKTGIVDYVGGNYYAACPKISLARGERVLYSNPEEHKLRLSDCIFQKVLRHSPMLSLSMHYRFCVPFHLLIES